MEKERTNALEVAAQEDEEGKTPQEGSGRLDIFFTHDTDFLRAVHEKKLGHEGILFAPQTKDIGKIIRKIEYIISILTAEDMKNHVELL